MACFALFSTKYFDLFPLGEANEKSLHPETYHIIEKKIQLLNLNSIYLLFIQFLTCFAVSSEYTSSLFIVQ